MKDNETTTRTGTVLVPYDRFFALCGKAFERHGDILDLPVGLHPYEYLKRIYFEQYAGGRVLDFGCGAMKPLKQAIGLSDSAYFACDNDESGSFEFSSPEDIPVNELFEIVSSSHVFEHLPFHAGVTIARMLASHVKPGGIMFIAVPNPKHPTRYLSSPVHVTPWNYLNICALMEVSGLDPFYCARTHKRRAPYWYERPLVNWLCRRFMMDWCDGIYVVGRPQRV
jgi:SAM-dependent methyltransferase